MLQSLIIGLSLGAIFALVAASFGLIYYTTRTFHLAHGAVYTLGGYLGYWGVVVLEWNEWYTGFFVAAMSGACGVLMELVVYRPLVKRRASAPVSLISSLGIYIVIVNLIALAAGNETRDFETQPAMTFEIGKVIVSSSQATLVFSALLLFLGFLFFFKRTPYGLLCRAAADNPVLINVLGLNVYNTRLTVFATGSALAGLAGYLAGFDLGLNVHAGFDVLLFAIVACIIGGVGNFLSPFLGALIVGLLQVTVGWYGSIRWQSAAAFAFLIFLLLVRPEGMFGTQKRVEET